jgi:hypothetical protein
MEQEKQAAKASRKEKWAPRAGRVSRCDLVEIH